MNKRSWRYTEIMRSAQSISFLTASEDPTKKFTMFLDEAEMREIGENMSAAFSAYVDNAILPALQEPQTDPTILSYESFEKQILALSTRMSKDQFLSLKKILSGG